MILILCGKISYNYGITAWSANLDRKSTAYDEHRQKMKYSSVISNDLFSQYARQEGILSILSDCLCIFESFIKINRFE